MCAVSVLLPLVRRQVLLGALVGRLPEVSVFGLPLVRAGSVVALRAMAIADVAHAGHLAHAQDAWDFAPCERSA